MVPPRLLKRLRPAINFEKQHLLYLYSITGISSSQIIFAATYRNILKKAMPAIPAKMVRNMFLESKAVAKVGRAAQR